MPRGVKTKPEIKEKAIALYAKEASYSEVGRQLKLARQTATDLIAEGVEFSEFRQQVEQGYIIRTWKRLERMEDAIEQKLMDSEVIDQSTLLDLVSVAEKFHKMVTNVANHINAIQVNVQVDTNEDLEYAAFQYVAEVANMSVAKVKERLGINVDN